MKWKSALFITALSVLMLVSSCKISSGPVAASQPAQSETALSQEYRQLFARNENTFNKLRDQIDSSYEGRRIFYNNHEFQTQPQKGSVSAFKDKSITDAMSRLKLSEIDADRNGMMFLLNQGDGEHLYGIVYTSNVGRYGNVSYTRQLDQGWYLVGFAIGSDSAAANFSIN